MIRWWELRRILYNLAVGVVGLISVAVMLRCGQQDCPARGRLCRAFGSDCGMGAASNVRWVEPSGGRSLREDARRGSGADKDPNGRKKGTIVS